MEVITRPDSPKADHVTSHVVVARTTYTPAGSDARSYTWPHTGDGVPGFTPTGYGAVVAHARTSPSPMSNDAETSRASNEKVNPANVVESLTLVGPSVHSHTGNPTGIMFHLFTLGSGPKRGVASGKLT